jgi:hypothetical protein
LKIVELPGFMTYAGLNAFAPPAPIVTDSGPEDIAIPG